VIRLSVLNPSESNIISDGILNISKEPGWTSHDVVAKVRRLLHQKRVGHAGTLDPAATGVLPVCVGQATRLVEYLGETGKAYRATITFGITTDSYDAKGQIISQKDIPPHLDRNSIETILPEYTGDILQVPPMYSALKRDGKRLYELAREGTHLELEARPVRIDSLTIISWESPTLVLDIECGKGTYIRSLAYDLGCRLGPGAHLASLVRTRVGPFTIANAITLDQLAVTIANDRLADVFYASDEALVDIHAAILATPNEQRLRQGIDLHFPQIPHTHAPEDLLCAYSIDGRFLGILQHTSEKKWHPHKVFNLF
jgi:tRNA pseudouridine55 synthase